jgi:hypothetical protein
MTAIPSHARRLLARLLIVAALVVVPTGVAACGSGGHIVGGYLAHQAANHLFPGHRKAINKAFCAYNAYRAFKDFTGGHKIYGALNVYQAIRNCEAGFRQ